MLPLLQSSTNVATHLRDRERSKRERVGQTENAEMNGKAGHFTGQWVFGRQAAG